MAMRKDFRLARMLHVLIHMEGTTPITSARVGAILNTNPVVARRMLGGLREAGIVRSEKGHGGGWTLVRSLSEITLLDVHDALSTGTVFAIGMESSDPGCLVQEAVNGHIEEALHEAEQLLRTRLGAVALSEIAKQVEGRTRLH